MHYFNIIVLIFTYLYLRFICISFVLQAQYDTFSICNIKRRRVTQDAMESKVHTRVDVLSLQSEDHDVAVSAEHYQDIPECVQKHDLGRHAFRRCKRVVEFGVPRIKSDLWVDNNEH